MCIKVCFYRIKLVVIVWVDGMIIHLPKSSQVEDKTRK